jgi:hypothetical protein
VNKKHDADNSDQQNGNLSNFHLIPFVSLTI